MTQIDLTAMSLSELKKLEKEVAKAIANFQEQQRQNALAAAEAAAREHGFSLTELTGVSVKKAKAASPAKYAHPENPSLTWSGRGRQPAWFKEAVEGGKAADDLLVA